MRHVANNQGSGDSTASPGDALAGRIMDCLPHLQSVARGIVGEANLAEDVVAQTLLRAWSTRAQLRDPGRLQGWLIAICRNEAATLMRSRRRHGLRVLPSEQLVGYPAHISPGAGHDLLDDLPGELKVCAELFFIEGRSYAEVARLTGLPLSTIRGRIHLSRQRLKKEIEMSSEPVRRVASDQPQILRPKGRRVAWRQTRVHLLGVARFGSQTIYDGTGKRLSRLPAALRDSELFDSVKTGPSGPDGFQLAFFCEVTGQTALPPGMKAMGSSACSPGSGRPWLPTSHRYEHRPDRTLECFQCGQPPEAREVSLRTRLWGGEDRTRPRRFVPEGQCFPPDDFMAISGPGLGVLFLSERRPGPKKGSCTFTLVLSTDFDQQAMRVLVVDRAGREVEPFRTRGGSLSAAPGHLHAETIDVQMPPAEVAGVAIYPRFTAEIDWGKVRLPPAL